MHGSEEMAQRLLAAVQTAVPQALEEIRTEAAALCPVSSGQLRSSLHVRMGESPSGAAGEVVADVPYATVVELGTFHQPAQPYLLPAFALVRPRISAMLHGLLTGG